jgi:hypothetical protein
MPSAPKTPAQRIVQAAKLYHRGILGPGETWNQILEAIGESEVGPLLCQLTPDEQRSVKAVHSERPESLTARQNCRPPIKATVADLLRWCEEPARGDEEQQGNR